MLKPTSPSPDIAPTPTQASNALPQPAANAKVAQSQLARNPAPDASANEIAALATGNSAFALDFYQAVRAQDGNLFYSPYSISTALAMTYAGARGETEAQMAKVLHFALSQDRLHPTLNTLAFALESRAEPVKNAEKSQPFQLSIANSIWGQQGYTFLPEFLDLLALNYGSGLRLEDFASDPETARLNINGWVSEQTHEKIKDLLQPGVIDATTRLVLVNAIYFKANWLFPFSKDLTRDGVFSLLDGGQVNVPMMTYAQPSHIPYAQGQGYQVVELPYVGDTVAMDIIIPDAGTFLAFEASLNADQLAAILAGLEPKSVALFLPKFSFETPFSLKPTLAGMGMSAAFDPGLANFSGIDGTRSLFIGAVIHKAFVAVDEDGAEAAAATAVAMMLTAMPSIDVELRIDRPFIFLIRDKPTGAILFVGRVINPAP
jgi:serpin B